MGFFKGAFIGLFLYPMVVIATALTPIGGVIAFPAALVSGVYNCFLLSCVKAGLYEYFVAAPAIGFLAGGFISVYGGKKKK